MKKDGEKKKYVEKERVREQFREGKIFLCVC